jgi:DNA-binding GntR family transcriptional regulator
MANNQTRRIAPTTLQADRDSFAALQAITSYAPANSAYSVTILTTLKQAMDANQVAETQAAAALAAARDAATAAEWEFHNALLGAKEQVIAQFGKDSHEIQALGLKKKSEYARGGSRTGTQAGAVK